MKEVNNTLEKKGIYQYTEFFSNSSFDEELNLSESEEITFENLKTVNKTIELLNLFIDKISVPVKRALRQMMWMSKIK